MKTIEQVLREILSAVNWDYGELEESNPELIFEAKSIIVWYAKEAIKADRENVANYIDDILYKKDRMDLINAPSIELK